MIILVLIDFLLYLDFFHLTLILRNLEKNNW